MKKRCSGFTLAEILIALVIIGVIAVMTIPTLVVNINQQKIGPALSKTIASLELASKMALQDNDARVLNDIAPNETNAALFDNVLNDYIRLSPLDTGENSNFKTYTNLNIENPLAAYNTPDGFTFVVASAGDIEDLPLDKRNTLLDRMYTGRYYDIYVDVNGNQNGPNILGRDLFNLLLDTRGIVIPNGGVSYRDYRGTAIVSWHTRCANGEAPTAPISCAGAIVDNNYKVMYNWNF